MLPQAIMILPCISGAPLKYWRNDCSHWSVLWFSQFLQTNTGKAS